MRRVPDQASGGKGVPPSDSPAAGRGRLRRRDRVRQRARRFLPPTAEEVGRAAALCFRDAETDEQIARQLGIVRRMMARWKQRTDPWRLTG